MKFLILVCFLFLGTTTFAADVDVEALGPILKPVLELIFTFLPSEVIAVISLIGGFRVLFKPIMSLFEAFAIYTPSKKDDELYKQVSEGNVYKSIRFLLDFIASIKLPKKK